jgi:hypothetical protein
MLERRAAQAKAREQSLVDKHKNADTFKATVDKRPRFRVGYRSLYKTISTTGTGGAAATTNAVISISASEAATRWFEGVAAGAALTDANAKLGLDYSNVSDYIEVAKFTPSKIFAVVGGTPTAVRTKYNSRYVKYTANSQGEAQSSYTAPISIKAGTINAGLIITAAQAIAIDKKKVVGEYGRMWYELEYEPTTLDID